MDTYSKDLTKDETFDRSELLRITVNSRDSKKTDMDLCKAWSPQTSPHSLSTPNIKNNNWPYKIKLK